MTGAAVTARRRLSLADRALRLLTETHAGESGTVLLLALNVFLILAGYQLLRVLREPLIALGGGAVAASYASAGQAILLLGFVPLYGAVANRVPRRTLINLVTGFFIACLAGFFVLAQVRAGFLGVAFYIWIGIFNVTFIAQFWSFANDVYTEDEGKRLFPIVAFGASAGAVFGSWIAGQLIQPVGLNALMLVAAAVLVAATLITNVVDLRERRRTELAAEATGTSSATLPAATPQYRSETGEFRTVTAEYRRESGTFRALKREDLEAGKEPAPAEPAPEPRGGSFRLVFQSRYLLLIAVLILLLNLVNTTGNFVLRSVVNATAAAAAAAGQTGGLTEGEFIGQFYAGFNTAVNILGLVIQAFLVSRILKYFGVRVALFILPVIALIGYGFLAVAPVLALAAVRLVKTAENATDYSLQNTLRAVLFLPTTREEKYKAKQAIDAFFVRAGDVLSAGFVFLGTSILTFQTRQFAMVNVALVAVWLAVAAFLGRRYKRLAATTAT